MHDLPIPNGRPRMPCACIGGYSGAIRWGRLALSPVVDTPIHGLAGAERSRRHLVRQVGCKNTVLIDLEG
jgi:hypothetical protein